jgi:hypothetical protein
MASTSFKINKEKYPNAGRKWTDEEEDILLEELDKNIDIDTIAENHSRTTGGINSRCNVIAYKMYLNNIDVEEIIKKTKLSKKEIQYAISLRENRPVKKEKEKEKVKTTQISIQPKNSEIAELKTEIIGLKKDVKEMLRLIHELYAFETS